MRMPQFSPIFLPMLAWILAGLLPVGTTLTSGAAPAPSPPLSPCTIPDFHRPARCGVIEVPEDARRPSGRRISLYVVVVPATEAQAMQPDPILFLSGGPGQAATDSVADIGESLASYNRDRDLVFIDQRGTGRSAPLNCALFSPEHPEANLRDFLPPDAVDRCAKALQGQVDVSQFSFRHFADDLEAVRKSLGYGPVNLYGLSYGTRAAQHYMRTYPKSVRTAYLGSLVPIDIATPLPFARAAQSGLDRTFEACAAEAACAKAYPDLKGEFSTVMARLDAGVSVTVPGSDIKAPLSRGRVAEYLRYLLYKTDSAAEVPWMIHRAYLGDWTSPVAGILEHARNFDKGFSSGLFLTLTCSEDVAFLKEQDIAPETDDTFLGDYRVRNQQAACARWPTYQLPPRHRRAFRSDVPTLIVSGDLDPATPLAFTTHAAPGFSRRAEIILHGQGHSGWSDCADRAYTELVRSGSVKKIDTDCTSTPRPPFKVE
jgi:pimeloyl-ACP methyl ester carboxylesterase